jgi:hypothetical protein
MVDKLQEYYDSGRIGTLEIYKGKKAYTIPDMGKKAYAAGARMLMTGTSLDGSVRMVTTGPLSSQDRFDAGIIREGMSSEVDHMSGGAAHVFTRMITEKMLKKEEALKPTFETFNACVVFDLDALAPAGSVYAYEIDQFGRKGCGEAFPGDTDIYAERKNLEKHIQFLEEENPLFGTNEVMVKNRIGPEHVSCIIVKDNASRNKVINSLKQAGAIREEGGVQYVRNIPLEKFVRVGVALEEDMAPVPK